MRLDELAKKIGAELDGDGSIEVTAAATLEDALAGQVAFVANPKYQRQLETTKASAVIVGRKTSSDRVALLRAADPYFAFAQAVVALHGYRKHPHAGISPAANVDPTATVGQGTVIYPGAYVGSRAKVGRQCILYPNVVVYDDCVLGDRVIIHSGSAIGCDGFGYATHGGEHHKIPQAGNAVIEDDVEIGANCAVARAAMGSTVIGKGTKIDALVMIGHGTKIGPHCLLVSQVGIAGSVSIGHHGTIGGQSGVAGHLKIGDNVTLAAGTGIIGDVESGSVMLGTPAMPIGRGRRVWSLYTQLPEIVERIKKLEREKGQGDKGTRGQGEQEQ